MAALRPALPCYYQGMASASRRSFLLSAVAACRLFADGYRGTTFPSESQRYQDPTTDLDVYRLTDPAYSSTLPAYYNRDIARNSSYLLFSCDRNGSPQAFRMDLKSGSTRQLTDVADLDGSSLTLTPDNRSFCYFAGRSLYTSNTSSLRERKLYDVPEDWERSDGMSVGPDGTHATFAEQQGDGSRLRMVTLGQGIVRTVVEAPVRHQPSDSPAHARADPLPAGRDALWLVNTDGKQNRQLKMRRRHASGRPIGRPTAGPSLSELPRGSQAAHRLRELTPDTDTDKLVAKTSQFAAFGFNTTHPCSSAPAATRLHPRAAAAACAPAREMTLCEHKASHPVAVAPQFSPDSQRIYFQSDRHGKPAIYDARGETGGEDGRCRRRVGRRRAPPAPAVISLPRGWFPWGSHR